MGKRFLSVLLVLALCLSGIPAAVFADESSPAEETSAKPEFPFTDVKPGDWHYEHIRIAYINGIVTGMTPTTYVPEGNLTHAQIMVMSANLHSKQKKDDYDFQAHKKDGEAWYQVFEDYCKAEGIIDDRFDGRENENTTRGEVSFYFAHTMTPESYEEGQSVSLSDIENEPYREEIEKLALTDIVGGFPDGSYRPNELVTRGQASVFVRNTIDVIEELEEEAVLEETPADDTVHKNRKKDGGAPAEPEEPLEPEEPEEPEEPLEPEEPEEPVEPEEPEITLPEITVQPEDATVDEGGSAGFAVMVSGSAITYQWQVSADGTVWADATDEGSTTNTLTVTATADNNGYQYRCIVSNTAGSVESDPAVLTVILTPPEEPEEPEITLPEITTQPEDATADEGSSAGFAVAASGTELTYQWEVSADGTAWADATDEGNTTDTLTVTATANNDGYQYRCIVSNTAGSVTSDAAVLTVILAPPEPEEPEITAQPQDATVNEGKEATFSITAEGADSYQWEVSADGTNWTDATDEGNTTNTLTVTATANNDGYQYRCLVSNAAGSVTSETAVHTVKLLPPVITAQPEDASADDGAQVNFVVAASGSKLTYRWEYSEDGTSWTDCDDEGHDMDTLKISAVDNLDGRHYRCVVSNPGGEACSDAADLTVFFIPKFTVQPTDQIAQDEHDAVFTASAAGNDMSYRWQISTDGGSTWTDCYETGYDTDTLTVVALEEFDGYRYRCIVQNHLGETASSAAKLIVGIALDEEHFPDENFRAVAKTYDKDGNGALSWDEIDPVNTIELFGMDIASVKGIEYFFSLQSFYASQTQLTEADLTKNAELYQMQITKTPMTSLNVSGLTALQFVVCSENQLTNLNVTGCSNLNALYCHRNQLSAIDLSGVGELSTLYCFSNQLTSLDLRACTELAFLQCDDNQLDSLDLSRNSALTELTCDNNQLSSLNLSTCSGLQTLSCNNNRISSLDIGSCVRLSTLYFHGNLMRSINVSSFSRLVDLDCYDNLMTSLDVSAISALADTIGSGTRVLGTDEAGKPYYEFYKYGNRVVVDLDVVLTPEDPNNRINEANFPDQAFRDFVTGYDTSGDDRLSYDELAAVTTMDCSNRSIWDLTGLGHFFALANLDCSNNSVNLLNIGSCPALRTLICSGNHMSELYLNGTVETVDCSFNYLSNLNLKSCSSLQVLNCSNNSLPVLELQGLTAVTELSCDANSALANVDVSDCTGLVNLSCLGTSLTYLDVDDSPALREAVLFGERFELGEDAWNYDTSTASLRVGRSVMLNPEDPR